MHDYNKALRIAAYCRVSTDKDDQVNSLESQKQYFTEYICRNPMWELTEVYADEGVTGTSTKKRHAFNRMIADAAEHRFHLIITKEISRFARNTLDSIFYTRKLKDLGVGVLFMNDNINTLDADAELRLTIMSSIAQEESRKTSDRVKWGQKRRMEQGVVFGRDMLGYDVRDGKLYINEAGAETVRLIYHKFVNQEKGTHVIARELREAGIPTATYMKQWSNTVILRVLRNEKYCGDLIQKKTYTPSYLSHEKQYNRGEEEFVVLRNHHEPIISRELFQQAQEELNRRSPSKEQKAKYSNRYCFSGKVKCGICGNSYVSRSRKRKDGSVYRAWRCFESGRNGRRHIDKAGNEVGCDNRSLNDEDLKLILMQVVKNLLIDRETLTQSLLGILKSTANTTKENMVEARKYQQQIDALVQKKKGLIELFLNNEITKNDFQEMSLQQENRITFLEKESLKIKRAEEGAADVDHWLHDMERHIKALIWGDEWDDTFYRNILGKIIVWEDHRMDVTLKPFKQSMKYFICKVSEITRIYNKIPHEIKEKYRCHFGSVPGTEELAHLELVSTIVCQLTQNLSMEEIEKSGFGPYYIDHTVGIWPQSAGGVPFNSCEFQSKGDPITDLFESMAAEQKARSTYDNILRVVKDIPEIADPIKFLRAREVVHFQRFGEALRSVQEELDAKNFYAFNPSFDTALTGNPRECK